MIPSVLRNSTTSFLALSLLFTALAVQAQTNASSATNQSKAGSAGAVVSASATNAAYVRQSQQAEEVRAACIAGRRFICGKIVQILPDGLVVDSGYTGLMKRPFNESWLVSGTVSMQREPNAVEGNSPEAPCIGLVFLTGIPRKPTPKLYDYVVIMGYPAGEHGYDPVPTVHKTLRRFAAGLPTAVKLTIEGEGRK